MTHNKQEKKPLSGFAPPEMDSAEDSAPFSQKELRELSFEISARWFSVEQAPRLTLSAVHPWRIHAYWHITGKMMQQAVATAAEPHVLVLRFFDVTPNPSGEATPGATFDIEVEDLDNSWYVDIWQPGRRYIAELGLRAANQALQVFVRSNEIQVPHAEPSPFLAFDLARYRGAKPVGDMRVIDRTNYSVAQLTDLLPGFSAFPDVHPDAANQSYDEPDFPAAPLARRSGWKDQPDSDDTAAQRRERFRYGTDFPRISLETLDEESEPGMPTGTSPVDLETLPKLPEVDPQTVSDPSEISPPDSLDQLLTAEASSGSSGTETPGLSSSDEKSIAERPLEQPPVDRKFPEVRADIQDRETRHAVSPLSKVAANAPPVSVGAIEAERLDEVSPVHAPSLPGLVGQAPEHAVQSESGEPETAQSVVRHHAPVRPALMPVVALEEALGASYFSSATEETGLSLSVHLELSGTARADQILTLFGEVVSIDEHGRYAVQVELEKGPQLAALLRTQRKGRQEFH